MSTPATPEGLRQYDGLPAAEAALKAWVDTGGNITWHCEKKDEVRRLMPLLARALDRLAAEARRPVSLDSRPETRR